MDQSAKRLSTEDISPETRLAVMRDMFLCGSDICSWCISRDGTLLYSNCESASFFHDMYEVSYCSEVISKHLSESDAPCIANDRLGFVWIAAAKKEDARAGNIYLLGPFFTLDASEKYLRQSCMRLKISDSLVDELLRQLKTVPTIPGPAALGYAVMLHYCINGERFDPKDITFCCEAAEPEERSQWVNTTWHGTWETEKKVFGGIRDGKRISLQEFTDSFSGGNVGRMAPGDPLMQAKYEAVIFTALASRAAIMGGVSPEGSYNLADYFIQRINACRNTSDVYECAQEMLERVQERYAAARRPQNIHRLFPPAWII